MKMTFQSGSDFDDHVTGWGRWLGFLIIVEFEAELLLLVGHQEEEGKGEEDGQGNGQGGDVGRGGGGRCEATVSVCCFLTQSNKDSKQSINYIWTFTCPTRTVKLEILFEFPFYVTVSLFLPTIYIQTTASKGLYEVKCCLQFERLHQQLAAASCGGRAVRGSYCVEGEKAGSQEENCLAHHPAGQARMSSLHRKSYYVLALVLLTGPDKL